ncbi:RDD family protein [Aggregatimonas sangjinii]|uniref:RDD family protein n=1 Tax=Aggregatimonas sangjinii TaxID=2583587 RepID=A0A5B7SP32_9FLAO|nr:RDD family protein [Aggregatimonas sangjinii]QCW99178.1 RDD family protein [Aggregatimonas sangjinii]
MTRKEQLQSCKICQHQKKDLNRGIICGLTDNLADFEERCETFIENPKLKKRTEEDAILSSVDSKVASQGQRFANYLIDQIFVIGLGLLFGLMIGILAEFIDPVFLSFLYEDNRLIEWLLGSVLAIIYYSFFEGVTGRSIGKFFTKTKVVTEDGDRPNFSVVLTRSLCRCIPFNAFSFLANDGVGWHDKFSGTRVIEID